jgi:acyl carrier protein
MRSKDEIIAFMAETIEEVTLGQVRAFKINPHHHLIDDLGLDSLDYATVLLSTEKWLGIKVSEKDVTWNEIGTVGLLADFLASNLE